MIQGTNNAMLIQEIKNPAEHFSRIAWELLAGFPITGASQSSVGLGSAFG
jgi:hypothetical protein